ncbi:MAG: hypothetical protein C0490_06470 [Marivirga sp.]|nr:hypothetical protein [Marivirga sp.]
MKIAVIASDYPGPDLIYGDTFVHARAKQYRSNCQVKGFGYNPSRTKDRIFEYEGVNVHVTGILETFCESIREFNPDIITVHLLQRVLIYHLLSFQKPLFIFVHGYEALSWKRRLMNYTTPGDLRYLWAYFLLNRQQLIAMKGLASLSNTDSRIHFIFVSNWLKNAVESDWGMTVKNSHIIPNGINTDLFNYRKKSPELRKKILLLRSFKARNYANDIAMDAIHLLSKKSFFSELEFSIIGEGYLFPTLTEKIRHFPNVFLNNIFIENKNIPELYERYGVFLCPSRLDTQGVSMCEAMSAGLVPVTSPTGGIPEYTTDGFSSFQVKTPQEFAEKIEYLYNQPEVFLKMSENARFEVMQKINLSDTVKKEIDLFQSITSAPEFSVSQYRQCSHCILDTNDDSEITFDEKGVCSYCQYYAKQEIKSVKKGRAGEEQLEKLVAEIKASGKGKPYDSIIGISGGVDSTYLALKAKELGLRPLAVHFDNGWNSELAVNNIENIINRLGFDLHTFVIDWEEFRDLQLAFLKASVVDIELVTDHAIITKLYQLAVKFGIKYILSGANVVTEAVLPTSWIHDKRDHIHIRAINKQFGTKPLKTFPLFTTDLKWRVEWHGIKSVQLLDLMPYNRDDVKSTIVRELGWRDYGGKHYESVFTRFYQGYILPTKFKIDKRRAHLSNLICSGQITRDQALEELKKPAYDERIFQLDYEFVLKKLELSKAAFEKIMNAPVKKHSDYPVEQSIYSRFPLLRLIRPGWLELKRIRKLR